MAGIGIISNPKSGLNKRNPNEMKKLGYILGSNGEACETNSIDDIYKVAENFKKNNVDVLCINGGDGTNHVTLSVFIQVYKETPLPKVAILRGGTMNTVAYALNISGKPKDILVNIIQKYYAKEPFLITQRNLLRVDDDKYGFIFGNGIVYNFLNAYYKSTNPSPVIAAKTLAKSIFKGFFIKDDPLFKKLTLEIEDEYNNKWKNTRFMTIIASTIDHIGLGFNPTVKTYDSVNAFHTIGITSGPVGIISSLPKIWFNFGVSPSVMEEKVAKKIKITSLTEPFGYTIDGDMHSPRKELTVELGPKVNFIVK